MSIRYYQSIREIPKTEREYLRKYLSNFNGMFKWWLYELDKTRAAVMYSEDDKPIGLALLSDVFRDGVVWGFGVFVNKNHRGNGYAKTLTREIFKNFATNEDKYTQINVSERTQRMVYTSLMGRRDEVLLNVCWD